MAFGNKVLLRAAVHFYGVKQFEADEQSSLSAAVDLPAPDGRPGEAAFLPLIACRLLYNNSRAEPVVTAPLLWVLREAADEVIASESSAREFSFRHPNWREDTAHYDDPRAPCHDELLGEPGVGEIEELLVTTMPTLVAADSTRADQSFRAELVQGRKTAMLWAKLHAPRRGPAFFAAFGVFAMLEQTARDAPYDHVIGAMAGLLTLTDLYFDVLDQYFDVLDQGQRGFPLATMMAFQEAVTRTALADDPRAHLTAVRQEAGIHGIHGPDPWASRTDT